MHTQTCSNRDASIDIPIHLSWRATGSKTLTCWLQASTEISTLLGIQTCLHQHSRFLEKGTQQNSIRSKKKKRARFESQENLRR